MEGKHYVLVHGVCHGAWCWYKLKPQLQSSGNKVTVLDLAASLRHQPQENTRRSGNKTSLAGYSEPLLELLESLPPREKVALVGHSLGGLSIALAMEKFSHKIELAVFLATFVPDTKHPPNLSCHRTAAKTLIRRGSLLVEELQKADNLPEEVYGSVPKAYIVCKEDAIIPASYQRWMIENSGIEHVLEIQDSDHMPMLCKPQELSPPQA